MRPTLLTALALALMSTVAAASPVDVFGFGSRHAGRAGAVTAVADDFAATYYNPAGLAFGDGKRLTIGTLGATSNLHVNDDRIAIAEPLGAVVGATTPAPLGGPLADRIHVGIGLYLLPRTVVRIIARFPDEPFYPYYDNRTQRVVILPAVAVRIRDDLAVGVGVNYLATLGGYVNAVEGATDGISSSVARLHAGVRWRPAPVPGLDLALAFRQSFSIPFSTVATTRVAGEPINLDIAASGLFSPSQLVAGTAYSLGRVSASADVTWSRWSSYPGPYVVVRSELPLVGPLAGQLPEVPYRDTLGVRLGLETLISSGDAGAGYALRGGYAFENSPIPATQTGVTNLLDGPKHTVAGGLGLVLPDLIGGHRVRVDLHAQVQMVGARTMRKVIYDGDGAYDPFTSLRDEVTDDPNDPATQGAQISNPGYPEVRSGGQVLSGGLTVEVGF